MDNKNIGLIAVLGVAGYIAYSLYAKSKGDSSGGYNPNTGGGGSSGGSTKKKRLTTDQILALVAQTLDVFQQVQLTYNQKITAVKDIENMINSGYNQKDIEIAMQTKYNLNPAQVAAIVNRLYK